MLRVELFDFVSSVDFIFVIRWGGRIGIFVVYW